MQMEGEQEGQKKVACGLGGAGCGEEPRKLR